MCGGASGERPCAVRTCATRARISAATGDAAGFSGDAGFWAAAAFTAAMAARSSAPAGELEPSTLGTGGGPGMRGTSGVAGAARAGGATEGGATEGGRGLSARSAAPRALAPLPGAPMGATARRLAEPGRSAGAGGRGEGRASPS